MENYEEKYKNALSQAKQAINNIPDKSLAKWLQNIFPELKESEDERMRKGLINTFSVYYKDEPDGEWDGKPVKDIIAWLEKQGNVLVERANSITTNMLEDEVKGLQRELIEFLSNTVAAPWDEILKSANCYAQRIRNIIEKQGEQKSIDKVEAKFKVGDWIVRKDGQMFSDNKSAYAQIVSNEHLLVGDTYNFSIGTWERARRAEEIYRLWTIQDAKDGDVLASNKSIFIFQEEYIGEKPTAYGGLMNELFIEGNGACWTNEKCYPATKEQRDLLFQKMKEAGYEWDAEKKELKKIEQKPAWSEEDIFNFSTVSMLIRNADISAKLANNLSDWIKSLKERMKGE